ncbi:hypothetical protein [Microbacterium arborescens]
MKITLQDIDNRDDAGAPFEFTGDVDEVVKYLDGPLRGDLTEAASTADLDEAISALRAGDGEDASTRLRSFGVYLTTHGSSTNQQDRSTK